MRRGSGGTFTAPGEFHRLWKEERPRGYALPAGLRGLVEQALGRGLGPVWVHTGPLALVLCRLIGAEAFAKNEGDGGHIVFSDGLDVGSRKGLELALHEIGHVVVVGAGKYAKAPGSVTMKIF